MTEKAAEVKEQPKKIPYSISKPSMLLVGDEVILKRMCGNLPEDTKQITTWLRGAKIKAEYTFETLEGSEIVLSGTGPVNVLSGKVIVSELKSLFGSEKAAEKWLAALKNQAPKGCLFIGNLGQFSGKELKFKMELKQEE
jgi:RNA-splicing ligase RtcB